MKGAVFAILSVCYSALPLDAVINSQCRDDTARLLAGMSDDAHKFWLIRFKGSGVLVSSNLL